MRAFTIPDDPLLDEAAVPSLDMEPDATETHALGPRAEGGDLSSGEGEHPHPNESDEESDAPNAHKRPRLNNHGDQGFVNDGDRGRASRGNVATLAQVSLRQYVPSLVTSKKLRDHSAQELYWFASASQPEREVMAFALNLEVRDVLDKISTAIATSGVHADLQKHIKTYTGCLFFSPSLPYYSGSRGGAKSKELQKTVLNMLNECRVPNIPPADNHVATKNVLTAIGGELTNCRSNTKAELSKRKPEAANMDLGTFVANLTRNTNIKVTKEHYGRVAFLSHEYRRWESRQGELSKIPYWDWVDAALERARKKYANQTDAVNRQNIIAEDEKLFNKAVGSVTQPEERENWQKKVEEASKSL
ncbi:hypothetical protein RSOLAG22IIIB_09540 [Rhizoctonia solani]|uniref:Uncharacterized protein n=1 Tax=Rhizoctonia solani TaxID=456999 RepID=A0A0K6FYV1_9AGAM|nr:hypothetical protein RSOLAG22IIIB_09540 [Rhizoctonia solani]